MIVVFPLVAALLSAVLSSSALATVTVSGETPAVEKHRPGCRNAFIVERGRSHPPGQTSVIRQGHPGARNHFPDASAEKGLVPMHRRREKKLSQDIKKIRHDGRVQDEVIPSLRNCPSAVGPSGAADRLAGDQKRIRAVKHVGLSVVSAHAPGSTVIECDGRPDGNAGRPAPYQDARRRCVTPDALPVAPRGAAHGNSVPGPGPRNGW